MTTCMVVARRVEMPFESAVATAAAWATGPRVNLRGGSLRLDALPTSPQLSSPAVVATGRLASDAATIFRFTSVVVELDAWSRTSSELRVRPPFQHTQMWGERRRDRYFALAHEAVDHLRARLLLPHPVD